MAAPSKPSLAHLADRFNVEPPEGWVAGRGRGATGFTVPSEEDLRASRQGRGRGRGQRPGGPSREPVMGLDAEAKDGEMRFAQTKAFEETAASFDRKEAGYEIEPFNLTQERELGDFDADYNYVPRRSRFPVRAGGGGEGGER